MRFLFLLLSSAGKGGTDPARILKYNETLLRAGVLLAHDRLRRDSVRVRAETGPVDVRFAGSETPVETAKAYWLLEVRTREEASAWAGRCPLPDGSAIEVYAVEPGDAEGTSALGPRLAVGDRAGGSFEVEHQTRNA